MTNAGAIQLARGLPNSTGVALEAGGTVDNLNAGTISGDETGVLISSGNVGSVAKCGRTSMAERRSTASVLC